MSSKAQASLPADVHITLVATIGTTSAPVPPFLLFPGNDILNQWVAVRDESPKLVAEVTESGYMNGYMAKQ